MVRIVSYALIIQLLCIAGSNAQADNPYILNGSAGQINCNCYLLTQETTFQAGSIWNKNLIDLNESFDYKFNVFLGCNDSEGADGIAFVLQPIGTSIGAQGGGLGYDGVDPSVGILIDTWQNSEDNDPAEDHISIQKNGIIDHNPLTDLASPVSALPNAANIEDCQWHTLRIVWNSATQQLSAEIDGVERVKTTINLVRSIFRDNPMVFWGFTAATGGAYNEQKVCTSLNPAFYFPANQQTCFPAPISFIDSSASFGTIERYHWDFGDGVIFEEKDPPPHQYAQPGEYFVKLAILGNDGCISDTFLQKVVLGTKPVPSFTYLPFQICRNLPVNFIDSSFVQFGTINKWLWNIGGQEVVGQKPPPLILANNSNTVELRVETAEGCISDILSEQVNVSALPCPEIYVPSAFTPNGDGINDRFQFVAAGFSSIETFNIYNRYGQLIHHSTDTRIGWDGRFKGQAQPSGAYVWIIRGTDMNGTRHVRKGVVTLVR